MKVCINARETQREAGYEDYKAENPAKTLLEKEFRNTTIDVRTEGGNVCVSGEAEKLKEHSHYFGDFNVPLQLGEKVKERLREKGVMR